MDSREEVRGGLESQYGEPRRKRKYPDKAAVSKTLAKEHEEQEVIKRCLSDNARLVLQNHFQRRHLADIYGAYKAHTPKRSNRND